MPGYQVWESNIRYLEGSVYIRSEGRGMPGVSSMRK